MSARQFEVKWTTHEPLPGEELKEPGFQKTAPHTHTGTVVGTVTANDYPHFVILRNKHFEHRPIDEVEFSRWTM